MTPAAILLSLVTIERLAELWLSRRNTAALLSKGAVEVAAGHYPLIVLLHALWLSGLWIFAWALPISATWLGVFLVLQLLRAWILLTLGRRWTTRIIVLPGAALVTNGPYRYVSHPNYLVVVAEIAVLPLCFGLHALRRLANGMLEEDSDMSVGAGICPRTSSWPKVTGAGGSVGSERRRGHCHPGTRVQMRMIWRSSGAAPTAPPAPVAVLRAHRPVILTGTAPEEDKMKETVDYGDLDASLDVIAAWLIAAYGGRIERISLWLEGYYGPVSECSGIAPVTLDRGVRPDGGEETRETLPSREVRDHPRRSSPGSAPEYGSFGSQAATSARSPVRTS